MCIQNKLQGYLYIQYTTLNVVFSQVQNKYSSNMRKVNSIHVVVSYFYFLAKKLFI